MIAVTVIYGVLCFALGFILGGYFVVRDIEKFLHKQQDSSFSS